MTMKTRMMFSSIHRVHVHPAVDIDCRFLEYFLGLRCQFVQGVDIHSSMKLKTQNASLNVKNMFAISL